MKRVSRNGLVIAAIVLATHAGCSKQVEAPPASNEVVSVAVEAKPEVSPKPAAGESVTAASDASVAAASDTGGAAAGGSPAAPIDAAPSAAEASLAATCAEIARVSDAAFEKVAARKKELSGKAAEGWPDLIPSKGLRACVSGAGGAYAIEVSDGSYDVGGFDSGSGEEQVGSTTMTARLLFVDEHGARTELADDEDWEAGQAGNFTVGPMAGRWCWIAAVHDWNGDGKAEVALGREVLDPIKSGSTILLYRLGVDEGTHKPRLERWLPLGDTPIEKVADEDGDGHLDLFSDQAFSYSSPNADVPIHPDGVYFFYHAKADGTFESGGDAAKAYYRKACGPTKVTSAHVAFGQPREGESLAGTLFAKAVCARLYGATVSAILKRVNPLMKHAFDEEISADSGWLADVPVSLTE